MTEETAQRIAKALEAIVMGIIVLVMGCGAIVCTLIRIAGNIGTGH